MLYQFSLDNKTWKKLGSIKSQTYGMFKQTYGIFEINNICYVVDTYGITTIPPDNKFYKYPSNKQNGLCETCKFEDQILFFNDEGKGNQNVKLKEDLQKSLDDKDFLCQENLRLKSDNEALMYKKVEIRK